MNGNMSIKVTLVRIMPGDDELTPKLKEQLIDYFYEDPSILFDEATWEFERKTDTEDS